MDNRDYDIAIGKLMRLKYILRYEYYAKVDELIDMLLEDVSNRENNYNEDGGI